MTKTDLKDLTDEQLFLERKKVKTLHLSFFIVYAILFFLCILIAFRRKEGGGGAMVFIILPLSLGPIMLIINSKNKALKEEIKRRGESNS